MPQTEPKPLGTPIADFVREYAASGCARFHMPGHKGAARLGCEALDITEIEGADCLGSADGIIAQSEKNASAVFGSGATFYATEGSSICIRAMLHLALQYRPQGASRLIVAARNVHRAFLSAAALLDFEILWLHQSDKDTLCSCTVEADALAAVLDSLPCPPAAVYITSPDYLGNEADLPALCAVCHARGTRLLVDNAHGAYLRFLPKSRHPMQCGADLCCDSAHKTLPVLTGGAYLHLSASLPRTFFESAREALLLFASTSPSYLTLASLDLCNAALQAEYPAKLQQTCMQLDRLRLVLQKRGYAVQKSDPLRITLRASGGQSGTALANALRRAGAECEYADRDFLVLMATPDNSSADFERLLQALPPCAPAAPHQPPALPSLPQRVLSVRAAMFAKQKNVSPEEAVGCICGAPTVSCPPAVPIVMCGERIGHDALALFRYYGIETVRIVEPPQKAQSL